MQALQELKDLGAQQIPVTIIDDETVVGFDKERIETLLGMK